MEPCVRGARGGRWTAGGGDGRGPRGAQRVTQIASGISGATRAQATTFGENGQAIPRLGPTTPPSASLVETSAAAVGLTRSVQALYDSTALFQLKTP